MDNIIDGILFSDIGWMREGIKKRLEGTNYKPVRYKIPMIDLSKSHNYTFHISAYNHLGGFMFTIPVELPTSVDFQILTDVWETDGRVYTDPYSKKKICRFYNLKEKMVLAVGEKIIINDLPYTIISDKTYINGRRNYVGKYLPPDALHQECFCYWNIGTNTGFCAIPSANPNNEKLECYKLLPF